MSQKSLVRLIILLALSLVLMYVGRHSTLQDYFRLEYLTHTLQDSGAYGVLMFAVVYVIGTLMNIPGMIFLFVLFLVHDGWGGFLIGYVTTLLSMVAHFYFTRGLAGEVLSDVQHPLIKRFSDGLVKNPLATVIILRLLLFISPPVNYALALSSIRTREFILGSMIAMPVNLSLNYLLAVYAKDLMFKWFG